MLFTETVPPGTLELIRKPTQDPVLQEFHLVGGTALSLQIGHRKSVDIDLFTDKAFDSQAVSNHLAIHYQAHNQRWLSNGVWSFIGEVKMDIMSHQYPWLKSPQTIEGIRMVSLPDIAAMKVNVIFDKGTRWKDFADIYSLLQHLSLKQILDAYQQKYPDTNRTMARNSLLYRKDLKKESIDFIGLPVSVRQVNSRIKKAVLQPDEIFSSSEIILLQKKQQHRRKGRRP